MEPDTSPHSHDAGPAGELKVVLVALLVSTAVIVAGGVATALSGTTAGFVAVAVSAVVGIGLLAGAVRGPQREG